jgi:hypothetical protein
MIGRVLGKCCVVSRESNPVSLLYLTNSIELQGELGFFRLELGKNLLMIESKVTWATPGRFSVSNYPCTADGDCLHHVDYVDPSKDLMAVQRRFLRGV